MSWQDITRRMLQPVQIEENGPAFEPHTMSRYGKRWLAQEKRWDWRPAIDFNSIGGQNSDVNKGRPAIRAPVDGIVENAE